MDLCFLIMNLDFALLIITFYNSIDAYATTLISFIVCKSI
jgi:hypothetical protein